MDNVNETETEARSLDGFLNVGEMYLWWFTEDSLHGRGWDAQLTDLRVTSTGAIIAVRVGIEWRPWHTVVLFRVDPRGHTA